MSGSRKLGVPADRIDPAQQQQSQQQQQYRRGSQQIQGDRQQAYATPAQYQDNITAPLTSRPIASFGAQYQQLSQQSVYPIGSHDPIQQPGLVGQLAPTAWSPRSTQMATYASPVQQPEPSAAYAGQYSAAAYEPRASHGQSYVSRDYTRTLPQSQQYYGTHDGLPSIQHAYVPRFLVEKTKLTEFRSTSHPQYENYEYSSGPLLPPIQDVSVQAAGATHPLGAQQGSAQMTYGYHVAPAPIHAAQPQSPLHSLPSFAFPPISQPRSSHSSSVSTPQPPIQSHAQSRSQQQPLSQPQSTPPQRISPPRLRSATSMSSSRSASTSAVEGSHKCSEPGCTARAFSTYGNLRRHMREQHGEAKKHQCGRCGQAFTRSTARDNHVKENRCKRGAFSGGDTSSAVT